MNSLAQINGTIESAMAGIAMIMACSQEMLAKEPNSHDMALFSLSPAMLNRSVWMAENTSPTIIPPRT